MCYLMKVYPSFSFISLLAGEPISVSTLSNNKTVLKIKDLIMWANIGYESIIYMLSFSGQFCLRDLCINIFT